MKKRKNRDDVSVRPIGLDAMCFGLIYAAPGVFIILSQSAK